MSQSTRQHERVDVEVAAEVDLEGTVLLAASKNLSAGGVALETESPLPKGATVGLSLFLTLEGIEDADVEPLTVQATVVWSTERGPGAYTAGVRYSRMGPAEKLQIETFVKAVQAASAR
jgi:c-di-GMP-binding flagellar brake protein YcgR